MIVYFDPPNIDLLYRNLPICLGFSSIFDFVVDTPPRQNANKICFCTRLNRIFVIDKFFPLPMKLFIKNTVCPRCILVVRDILRQAGIEASSVVLGEAVLPAELTAERRKELDEALRAVGFELIDDRRKQTVERVKNTVIELVREKDAALRTNLSDYIADRLHQDYGAVSSLFSEIENTTIEQYFIAQKIERVKELLAYGELSLGEIADKLNYSSTAHLSAQFKKVTGLTPSHFRKIGENRRKPLDKV